MMICQRGLLWLPGGECNILLHSQPLFVNVQDAMCSADGEQDKQARTEVNLILHLKCTQTSKIHIGQIVTRCCACSCSCASGVRVCECNKSENVCKGIISAFAYGCVPSASHSHTRMLVSVSFYSSTSPLHTGPRRALSTAILKFV